jgi:hypothetical protein
MEWQHKQMAEGGWQKLSLVEQLANIGSEVERALAWQKRKRLDYSQHAFWRALELLALSKQDPKNKTRLKELCRLYEVLVDYFAGENEYGSTPETWRKYFFAFSYAARQKYNN